MACCQTLGNECCSCHGCTAYSEVVILCSRTQGGLQVILVPRYSIYQGVEHLHGRFGFLKAATRKLCRQDCQGSMHCGQWFVSYPCPYNLHQVHMIRACCFDPCECAHHEMQLIDAPPNQVCVSVMCAKLLLNHQPDASVAIAQFRTRPC